MKIYQHVYVCVFTLAVSLGIPCRAAADKLQVTSSPPGATVEIDGTAVGKTPLETDLPGGYFHRTKTRFGTRLEHPMIVRVSLAGYVPREIPVTIGPMNWDDVRGHHVGQYWLLKAKSLKVELLPVSEAVAADGDARLASGQALLPGPQVQMEELVARTKPAVVCLKTATKSATGFFVTDNGVIATNAHIAHNEESLLAILVRGQQLRAKVVYVDPDLDLALAKVEGQGFSYLKLAEVSAIRQGERVIAIGNPGDAMPFSVTGGIVSAVGDFPSAGPGTWIQTDASINPGNSGGPLVNSRGQVVGMTTLRLKSANGIGFALSSSELLEALHRFFPDTEAPYEKLSAPIRSNHP